MRMLKSNPVAAARPGIFASRSGSARWLGLLLAALLLAACAAGRLPVGSPAGSPAGPPAGLPAGLPAEPSAAPPTVMARPATPAPAASPPIAEASPPPAAGHVAPLFGPDWGDRTMYRRGLVTGEQGILDGLPGASEYRIDLNIGEQFTTIAGRQQVAYTNREAVPLDHVFMRLFPNALGGEMNVSGVAVDGVGVQAETFFERTALKVTLPRPLGPGESAVLSLDFELTAPDTLEKGYGLISYTGGILALDTPYAAIPVFDDEGWNVETPTANADTSYYDASFYLARITAPAALKLVVTGVAIEREVRGATQTVTFAHGPARDFFVAGSTDYIVVTGQVGETQVNSYALAGQEKAAEIALDAAIGSLDALARRFGPYPYTEFDVAATPMLALGIEYPGAVGISAKIYDPDASVGSRRPAEVIESTVAHEVVHQWFYNLVGNDQIDEPWLDEALAEYSVRTYYADRYGQSAADSWSTSWYARWDRVDRLPKPVGLPAAAYAANEYSPIVYGRGPIFLSALAERMGQPVFDRFLGDYAARFRWGIATAADFKSLAEDACRCELDDLYEEWLDSRPSG